MVGMYCIGFVGTHGRASLQNQYNRFGYEIINYLYIMPKLLALDYGMKRTGVAATDDLQIIASGVGTVLTKDLFDFLKTYFAKNKVEALVVGEPKRMNNEDTHATPLVREFVEKFKKFYPEIPVHMEDERFTSKMASQSMIDMGMKKKDRQRKELVAEISAVNILQSYMQGK
jgi:putative Holliday junction resolvase